MELAQVSVATKQSKQARSLHPILKLAPSQQIFKNTEPHGMTFVKLVSGYKHFKQI